MQVLFSLNISFSKYSDRYCKTNYHGYGGHDSAKKAECRYYPQAKLVPSFALKGNTERNYRADKRQYSEY